MYILTKKPRSTASAGFTIVETLIVLIIAGLFLLVVFEALPALGRSSRNHSRKQDVQAILEAVSQYELNNSGDLPGLGSNFLQYYQLTYYKQVVQYGGGSLPTSGIGVYVYGSSVGPPAPPTVIAPNTSAETVIIYNYQKCSTTTPGGSVNSGAGYNDVVALYGIETGNNTTAGECEQL